MKSYLRTKKFIQNIGHEEHEIVFLLTCGPSLSLFIQNTEFRKLLNENTCISMKQAYDYFPQETDFHVVNEIRYKEYHYQSPNTKVLSVGNKIKSIVSDFHFPILEHEYKNSVFVTNNYSKNDLLSRPVFRPWGIGVMYELGMFLPAILKCKKLVIVGFDMNANGRYHFYDSQDAEDAEQYSVDKEEFIYNQTTIPHFENWLKQINIEVALLSPLSTLPFTKKLETLDELESFLNDR